MSVMDTTDAKQSPPMSNVDKVLKSECILSSKELFRYRKTRDKAPPQKGGAKDYAPDQSWLEKKKLEKFHQERKYVLSEQRVEMTSNLVVGEWNMEKNLVAFQKEIGKFWSHMGFIDHRRKWLYPEEALFLMETATLMVFYKGLPLSIQQAYTAFLSSSVSVEEYQVYAHLRRYGYVVLRHQGKIDITKYERQIGLDQYINKKRRKRKNAQKDHQQASGGCSCKKRKKDCMKCTTLKCEASEVCAAAITSEVVECEEADDHDSSPRHVADELNVTSSKVVDCDGETDHDSSKRYVTDKIDVTGISSEIVDRDPEIEERNLKTRTWTEFETICNLKTKNENKNNDDSSPENVFHFTHSDWNFSEIIFPDIGNVDWLRLSKDSKQFLPNHIEFSSDFSFDVEEYKHRRQKQGKDKDTQLDISQLEFSHTEILQTCPNTTAQNWSELKHMLKQGCDLGQTDIRSPAHHLWEGEITPLIKPTDAESTANILDKLQVIENVGFTSACHLVESVKISFDVYLPDLRFKKSSPGIPNHRICVLRSSDEVPGLGSLMNAQSKLTDNVPLNCAVVDCGEIVFYTFSNVSLPIDVTRG